MPKMFHDLSAQFVCPSTKIWDIIEKGLHRASVVRAFKVQVNIGMCPHFSFLFFDFTIASTNWVDKPQELSWQASRCKGRRGCRGCRGCSKYVVEQVLLSRHRCTILRSLLCLFARQKSRQYGGVAAHIRDKLQKPAKNYIRENSWNWVVILRVCSNLTSFECEAHKNRKRKWCKSAENCKNPPKITF